MAVHSQHSHDATTSDDETRPLLGKKATPLPKAQLATLCAVRLVDPITFTQIFPYVNEMMSFLHVTNDPSKIGFYSGLVESSFAISQLLSIYQWARLSDTIGRRPVILAGIAGIAASTIVLGMSRTFAGIILARCLAGLFSGNIAVIHSALGEITDSTNQAVAFPIYSLCWPLGSIIGPLLGGTFSNPATKFPQLFDYAFLRTYPYFLPCFMTAAVALLGVVLGCFCLDETLPGKRPTYRDNSNIVHDLPDETSLLESKTAPKAASIKNLLAIPTIRALCISGCALSFITTGFDVIFVLVSYSPIEMGGLAFSVSEIGYALATSGFISAALQMFLMPIVLRKYDHGKMYNFCMAMWPYCFILLPGLNLVARMGLVNGSGGAQAGPETKAILWIGIGVLLAMSRIATLAFSFSMILVKEHAPDPASLGVSNGLVQWAMCFARAFSPAFASSIFAFFAGSGSMPIQYLWAVIMTGVAVLGIISSRKILEGRAASRQ